MGFTGLKIEPHSIRPGKEVCIAYRDGVRIAAVYFHPDRNLVNVVYEAGKTKMLVNRRIPGTDELEVLWTDQ